MELTLLVRQLMRKNVLTIVVPCYNEAATLETFVTELIKVQNDLTGVKIELLLINDGSTDHTLDLFKVLAEKYPERIEYLSFSRNFGKEAGLYAGLQHAKGEWVAVMDADLQDPPEMLVKMYKLLQNPEIDVVAARRTSRAGEPAVRSWFADLYYKLNNKISDIKLAEGARDFRLMRYQVAQAVVSLPENNRFSKGIFSWVGFNVVYLEYPNVQRVAGETSWSFSKLFDYAIEGLMSFSDVPLTIASYVGLATFLFALVYGVYIILRTLFLGSTTPGWPSLAVLIVGMGGLQLLSLGIVGKYIGKIFMEGKHRPIYIVKEEHLFNDEGEKGRGP